MCSFIHEDFAIKNLGRKKPAVLLAKGFQQRAVGQMSAPSKRADQFTWDSQPPVDEVRTSWSSVEVDMHEVLVPVWREMSMER